MYTKPDKRKKKI